MKNAWSFLTFVTCFSCLIVSAVSQAQDGTGSWQAGLGRVDITPLQPMWMSGYGSRDAPADGKLTDLWAKALVLQDAKGNRALIVTLDLVGIDREISQRYCARIQMECGIPRNAIALTSTHTHSGPVVGHNLQAMYHLTSEHWERVAHYTRQLEDNIVTAVRQALSNMVTVELSWTVGRANFAVNRRANSEAAVPVLRANDRLRGPVDHDVPILLVRSAKDGADSEQPVAPLAILCGYACHATVLSGYQWCGDWPGYAQIAIEQQFPGTQAMVWAGCGADQNPLPRREVALAEDYGRQLANSIASALEQATIRIQGELQTEYAEIPLQLTQIPDRETLIAQQQSSDRFVAGRANVLLQQLEAEGRVADTYPYPIQTWQLGSGPSWIFLGGEVVVDYAVRLKELYHPGRTWLTAYANDVMAYIPSRRVLTEGGYEGAGAMLYYGLPGPWAEDVEERIVTEIARQLSLMQRSTDGDLPVAQGPDYPDHSDLSVFASVANELLPIQNTSDWEKRRQHILLGMQRAMGALPLQTNEAPAYRVVETESHPGCQRLNIRYESGDGDEVPAHLYLPEREPPATGFPVVLALHPTSPLGKRIVGGEGERPNRNYAIELAQRGYLVLAPDYPSFGDYADYNFHTDQYQSGTMKGIVNHIRGIDFLVNHPSANPQQVAVIGHSLGGHNALFVSAFDQRIKVTITSCGWTPFHDYYGGKVAGWTSARYMPRIRELYDLDPSKLPFDFYEVCSAIAPRIVYSCSPVNDENFAIDGVRKAEEKVRRVFERYNASENWQVRYPDAEHDFPDEQRQEAYQLLDRVFQYSPTP